MPNKDIMALQRKLRKAGYHVDETRTHVVVSEKLPDGSPGKALVTMSHTKASDFRVLANTLANLRRAGVDLSKRKPSGARATVG